MPLPKPTRPKWYTREWPHTLALGVVGVVTPIAVAWNLYPDRATKQGTFYGACAVVLLVIVGTFVKILNALEKDRKGAKAQSALDLQGCLYTIRAAGLGVQGKPCDLQAGAPAILRVTIHRVNEDGERIYQLLDYVGDDSGGRGREFSARSGVVGQALNTGNVALIVRNAAGTHEDWVEQMTRDYFMPRNEAAKLTRDRFSFLAIPIKHGNRAIGVVYLDSSDTGFFTHPVVTTLATAVTGLAQYASIRYTE